MVEFLSLRSFIMYSQMFTITYGRIFVIEVFYHVFTDIHYNVWVNICEYMIKDLNDKNSTIRYSEHLWVHDKRPQWQKLYGCHWGLLSCIHRYSLYRMVEFLSLRSFIMYSQIFTITYGRVSMTKTLPYVIVNICEYMIKDLNDKNSTIRYSEYLWIHDKRPQWEKLYHTL
jgi:hypothetical protein